jgi:hypothetical protein
MPLTFDGTAQARVDAPVRGACLLIEMDFVSGLQRLTTYSNSVVSGAYTYVGLGNIINVSQIKESEDTTTEKLEIAIAVTNSAMLALAIGQASDYRNRSVRLYLQLLTETGVAAGASVLRYSGYMDSLVIERSRADPKSGGSGGGYIKFRCSKSGLSRSRRFDGLRLTDAQQRQRFPGDKGLEYVNAIIEKPPVWLSRRFMEI